VGPGFLENAPGAFQNDLPTNIALRAKDHSGSDKIDTRNLVLTFSAAIRRFLRACIVKPVSQNDFEEILAFNMVVNQACGAR
jgi:hypothetical protein